MTASSGLTVRQQRIVDALRPFFGAEADALYEANGRSLLRLAYVARQSSLPSFHRLVTGLALAQELLAEELTGRSVFVSPRAVTDFLKLRFAGQPYESLCPFLWLETDADLRARRCHCEGGAGSANALHTYPVTSAMTRISAKPAVS
jgi:hypothetical protein